MPTFFNDLPPEIASQYQNIERKRQIQDALMSQALQPPQQQMARSGRYQVAVPYSPLEGATKLIQAAMMRKAADRTNKELMDLGRQYQAGSGEAVRNLQAQATGAVPWREPDVRGAVMSGAGSPYPAAQKVSEAMMNMQHGRNRGDYFTTVTGRDGELYKFNNRTGELMPADIVAGRYDPVTQGNIAQSKEMGKTLGGDRAQAQIDLPKAEVAAGETERLIDELITHPGMKDVIGFPDNPLVAKGLVPGTEAASFRSRLNQITGRTFMEIFPTLKGGGQITEIEGEKGQRSINRMNTATTEKEFVAAANDLKAEIKRLKKIVRQRAGKPPEAEGLPPGFVLD